MAVLTPDVYAAGSGETVYGGRFARPAWRRAMAPMTVAQIPTLNTLADLDPEDDPACNPNYPGNAPWHAVGGMQAMMGAWNGSSYDEDLDEQWWLNEGGHADFAANAPFKGVYRSDRPAFVMIRPPSGALNLSPFVAQLFDNARTQPGSTDTQIVFPVGDAAPLIYGGRDEASGVDGYYVGGTLTVGNNTPRAITAYDGTTHTATINAPLTDATVGVTFTLKLGGVYVHGNRGEQLMRYADGRVRATHTYNTPVHIPKVGPALTYTGASAWGGQTGTREFMQVDPNTGEATFGPDLAPIREALGIADGSAAGCYDALRNGVWLRGASTGKFGFYDRATQQWSAVGPSYAMSGNMGMCRIPHLDCLFVVNANFTNRFALFDCATATRFQPALVGSLVGAVLSGHMQPRWVPSLGGVAVWDNTTSTNVINLLTPGENPFTDPWTVSQLTFTAIDMPSAKQANGTYGRFVHSHRMNCFIVINSIFERPFCFALD